jgi:hypothetical protein
MSTAACKNPPHPESVFEVDHNEAAVTGAIGSAAPTHANCDCDSGALRAGTVLFVEAVAILRERRYVIGPMPADPISSLMKRI